MPGASVLAVDLDETLIRTDVLYESFWQCASRDPWGLVRCLGYLAAGKARFKAQLSKYSTIEPAQLAYNEEVLEYVRAWRAKGGKTALVTATDQGVAKVIADHLGLFDEVFGSDGVRNLKGGAKASFLVERYGAGNYDYIGDGKADLPVWGSAHQAITVGLNAQDRGKVRSLGGEVTHLSKAAGSMIPALKAIRPHQWSKNVLVFLPLIAAHQTALSSWIDAVFAFVCFSLVASSAYLLNDLLDLTADRSHPRKRHRPLASGALPLSYGTMMVPGLLVGGLLFCLFVGRVEFLGVMVLYFAVTMAYSLSLKRKLIIDICTLAGLYTLRIYAGGAATDLAISKWLLAFSIFFFFSLAAVKRQAELVDATNSGRETAPGRGYEAGDQLLVSMMAVSSGFVAVLVMALYLDTDLVKQLYHRPIYLWGICPILLYWISRMTIMAHRGWMEDDPIVFAFKDRISQYCGILAVLVILAGAI